MTDLQEKILAVLRENGPQTPQELAEALEKDWAGFYVQLLELVRGDFNPQGPVLQDRSGRDTLYRLAVASR